MYENLTAAPQIHSDRNRLLGILGIQASVGQKVDNFVHWIVRYPADKINLNMSKIFPIVL